MASRRERGFTWLDRLREESRFPWARPRREGLLLVLIAAVALSPVFVYNEQDSSRICLSRALVAGRLSNDGCFPYSVDHSSYGGHFYSNKAPGMSVLEIVPAEVVRLRSPIYWTHTPDLRLWAVHLFASGLPFLLCVFLVGRISEGLERGFGAPAMVTFGLGTLVAPLASSGFDHLPAAFFGFLAFVLAWRRRSLGAGLAGGAALTIEYEAAAVVLIVLAYVALRGRRAFLLYAAGVLPGAVLLAAYDWAAFGAPWHNPLRYSDNSYRAAEKSGLLGVHLPTLASTQHVVFGERGLLVTSPVLAAAALGLILLWRRGLRAEALVCGGVSVVFVVAECGYFIPYGGASPGPRFLVPALPFLALGLAPAFARWTRVTSILAGLSILAMTAVTLTWTVAGPYRNSIWGELGRVFVLGSSSPLARALPRNIVTWEAGPEAGAAAVLMLAAIAFFVALRPPQRGVR